MSENRFAQTFIFKNSKNHEIRTIVNNDSSVWFVAKDICKVLGIARTDSATRNLDDDEKGARIMSTPGGNQKITVINESGLYYLIFKSRKPGAIKFRKWVTNEVLPSIRKSGVYCWGQEPAPEPLPPAATAKQAVAFLQVATEAYWQTNKMIEQQKEAASEARKAKKAIAAVMNSIKEVFPDARKVFDEIAGQGYDSVYLGDAGALEVEMYGK